MARFPIDSFASLSRSVPESRVVAAELWTNLSVSGLPPDSRPEPAAAVRQLRGGDAASACLGPLVETLIGQQPVLVFYHFSQDRDLLLSALRDNELADLTLTYRGTPEERQLLNESRRPVPGDNKTAENTPAQLAEIIATLADRRSRVRSYHDRAGGMLLAARGRAPLSLLGGVDDLPPDVSAETETATIGVIRDVQRAYRRLGRIPPALNELNRGIFGYQDEREAADFVLELVDRFEAAALSLYIRIQDQLAAFGTGARRYYERQLQPVLAARDEWQREWAIFETEFIQGAGAGRSPGELARYKKAVAERQQALDRLADLHIETDLFPYTWPDGAATKIDYVFLRDTAADYFTALTRWRDDLPRRINEESGRLNAQTVAEPLGLAATLRTGEADLEELIAALNESGLYQRPFTQEAATTPRRARLLEQLLDRLRDTRALPADFAPAFRWQRQWFALPARLRRLIRPLMAVPEIDWSEQYQRWNREQQLVRLPYLTPPADPPSLDRLEIARADLIHTIRSEWRERAARTNRAAGPVVAAGDWRTWWRNRPADLADRYPIMLVESAAADHLALSAIPFGLIIQLDGPTPAGWSAAWAKKERFHWTADLSSTAGLRNEATSGRGDFWSALTQLQPAPPTRIIPWHQAEELAAADFADRLTSLKNRYPDLLALSLAEPPAELPAASGYLLYLPPGTERIDPSFVGLFPRILGDPATAVHFLNSASPAQLTAWLLSDGWQADFIYAVLARSVEALAEDDYGGWNAIRREVAHRSGCAPLLPHPFLEVVGRTVAHHWNGASCHFNTWEKDEIFLPLHLLKGKAGVVITTSGYLDPERTSAPLPAARTLEQLRQRGFTLIDTKVADWLADEQAALQSIMRQLPDPTR